MTKAVWFKDVYENKRTNLVPDDEYNIVYNYKYFAYIHFRYADKKWIMIGVYSDDDIRTFFKFCRDIARIVKHSWESVSFRITTADGKRYRRYYI